MKTPATNRSMYVTLSGRKVRSGVAAVSIVVMSIGLIVGVKLLLDPIIGHASPSLLFSLAIVVSTLVGKRPSGIAATILGAVLIEVLFQDSMNDGATSDAIVRSILFIVQGILIVIVVSARLDFEQQLAIERGEKEALKRSSAELALRNEEQQRTQTQLNQANKRLVASNRDLEEFAMIASHDLQEPLRKVHGFIDIILRRHAESLSDEAHGYIVRIQNATSRMQGLIDDLLTLSRVNTRASPFSKIDLNEVMKDVLQDLDSRVKESDAIIEMDTLPSIAADRTQMHQLFQNLIGNAIKFRRPDERPIIRIRCETNADSESMSRPAYRITVSDNGIGFDEKYLGRIFKVFQRLHGREAYDGTGIGLSVCQRIVTRHNGAIAAASAPGAGATFVVTLPAAQFIHHRGSDD